MADLTNTNLRTILSTILDIDEDYIVLKQRNWFTAQAQKDLEDKPMTWVAYKILKNTPVSTTGHDYDIDDDGNYFDILVTQIITDIELNFIGTRAEETANSIKDWNQREDVYDEFLDVNGALMNTLCDPRTFDYIQEGMNTVTGWAVNIKIARKSVVPTESLLIDDTYNFVIGGEING